MTDLALLNLLRLMEQPATSPEAAELRRALAESDEAARRWRLIHDAAELLDGDAGDAVEDELPAEWIAEFVDGRCDAETAARVEQDCWQSPAQLAEVLSAFRFQRAQILVDVSSRLTKRLLAAGPAAKGTPRIPVAIALPEKPPVAATAEPAPIERQRVNGETVERPVVEQRAEPVGAMRASMAARLRSRKKWSSWAVAGAAAILVALLGAGIVWFEMQNRTSGPGQNNVVKDDDGKTQRGSQGKTVDVPTMPDEFISPERVVDTEMEKPSTPVSPDRATKPEIVAAPPSSTTPLDKVPSPLQEPGREAPPESLARLDLIWKDAVGLVVADAAGDGHWHMTAGRDSATRPITIATASESWSSAELSSGGTIVLAADTRVTLARNLSNARQLLMTVVHGRVALRDLPKQSEIVLDINGISLKARAAADRSSLAVARDPASSAIFVPAGEMEISDTLVKAGRQVLWDEKQLSSPQPVKAALGWVQRAELGSRMPPAGLASLREADDLSEALRKLFDHPKPETRRLAVQWSLSIGETDALGVALNHAHKVVRIAALDYLLKLPLDDVRLATSMRTVARDLPDPQTGRMMINWFRGTRQRNDLSGQDARNMWDALNHSSLAVRQTAVYFLELHTRQQTNYDPAANPAAREAGLRQWQAILARRFPAEMRQRAAPNAAQPGLKAAR